MGLVGGLDDARVRLAGESPAPRTLDRLLAADVGPVELSAEPGVRRVIGVAGHYNAAERGVAHLRAEDFDAFDAPGSLKAVVEFTLTPQDGRADAARLRGAGAGDRRRTCARRSA